MLHSDFSGCSLSHCQKEAAGTAPRRPWGVPGGPWGCLRGAWQVPGMPSGTLGGSLWALWRSPGARGGSLGVPGGSLGVSGGPGGMLRGAPWGAEAVPGASRTILGGHLGVLGASPGSLVKSLERFSATMKSLKNHWFLLYFHHLVTLGATLALTKGLCRSQSGHWRVLRGPWGSLGWSLWNRGGPGRGPWRSRGSPLASQTPLGMPP